MSRKAEINAPWYKLPLVIDLSTIRMLLMVLTGWLDRTIVTR